MAPWINEHFPAHRVYTEAFGGAASVLLRKARSHTEVYGDLDGELVNLFAVARDRGEELGAALELTPFARTEFDLSYLASPDPLEQARRTVVRSFMGFGSNSLNIKTGFRRSSRNSGASPAGDWLRYPEALVKIVRRLQGVVIEEAEAATILRYYDGPETLHYVDPPYPHTTRGRANGYRFEMDECQHRDLAGVLHSLQGMVVLSGYDCELYDKELYPSWVRVQRRTLADGARPRMEVLWLNPQAISNHPQESLALWPN